MPGDQFELHFASPDLLELKSMEGKSTRYRRAHPSAPTAEDLKRSLRGDRDTFRYAGMFVRFRRDGAGAVVGLDYSNPVVRNISFIKLNDDRRGD